MRERIEFKYGGKTIWAYMDEFICNKDHKNLIDGVLTKEEFYAKYPQEFRITPTPFGDNTSMRLEFIDFSKDE
jgi:hypothetical protein